MTRPMSVHTFLFALLVLAFSGMSAFAQSCPSSLVLPPASGFASAPWGVANFVFGYPVVTNNVAVAPDSTTTAAQFTSPVGSDPSFPMQVYQSVATNSGVSYTLSVWVKAVSTPVNFRLAANSYAGSQYSPQQIVTSSWEQVSWTFTAVAGSTYIVPMIVDAAADPINVYMWCAALSVAGSTGNPHNTTFPGSLTVAARAASSTTDNIDATADYFVCADNSGGAATEKLPAGAFGLTFLIKDCSGNAATHSITIVPASGTIDGAPNFVMGTNYQSAAVTYTGSQWSLN